MSDNFRSYLETKGEIFRSFADQDSGCISYGVKIAGQKYFIKFSNEARGIASLQRARLFGQQVQHSALAKFHGLFPMPTELGLALQYNWLDGEVLYDYTRFTSEERQTHPKCAHVRFRALPLAKRLKSLDVIYTFHLELAKTGYIAVDFYDGCVIYDFEKDKTYLCDMDEYQRAPFILSKERLPGSSRFMAPEEFQRGAKLDGVTNVYTLGKMAAVLLGDSTGAINNWSGTESMAKVIERATRSERRERYPSVADFVRAWQQAVGQHPDRS